MEYNLYWMSEFGQLHVGWPHGFNTKCNPKN